MTRHISWWRALLHEFLTGHDWHDTIMAGWYVRRCSCGATRMVAP